MTTQPELRLPDKPSIDGIEAVWERRWEEAKTYAFDRTATREQVYSIDTPPPTVSGSLHVGHVFSYTHTDCVARYQRMRGKTVFYPMGWDDNGLPTERRVQNYYGVRCEPSLPYVEDFEPPAEPPKEPIAVSRRNFVELCDRLTQEDEKVFESLWRRLGLSVDWSMTYATIDVNSRTASQRAFLRNLERGEAYLKEAPTLWDVTFRTAVAQAELEDRERPGAYHRIAFQKTDGSGPIHIETTRPVLIPACVALVAHPDDERYKPHFGTTVTTPVFGVEVPIVAHKLADPEKGSGIAMICTFGDVTDVTWWRELDLPTRAIIGRDGRIIAEMPEWITTAEGRTAYELIAGATVHTAQERVVEMVKVIGALEGEPRAITHPVKFYEKGDKPLEIVTTRQWYVKNGGRDEDLKAELLARGRELTWHPAHMRFRYENWVEGLTGDWLISRQRFFGVPIPVWYPLDANGEPDFENPIVAKEADLPIDPSSDTPAGFTADQRGVPGGFMGDPDVMDTWATSSLSPQVAAGWERDADLWQRVYPMDLRPQGHDIIRTWLFSTVVRSHLEENELPWKHAAMSGWILDPDRKKMSKSKGNVVTPMGLLEEHGSDAVRYWAASGRPGTDTAFDVGQMKIGRRLAMKILNASKFVLMQSGSITADASKVTNAYDKALLAELKDVIAKATSAFDDYEYTSALEATERFFWAFCDDYVELVKERAYGQRGEAEAESAKHALAIALTVQLRLFAPFLPFVTDEVWSWFNDGSIHNTTWPATSELDGITNADRGLVETVSELISAIRKVKSEAKVSMKAEIETATVIGSATQVEQAKQAEGDVKAAGRIHAVEYTVDNNAPYLDIAATLAPTPEA